VSLTIPGGLAPVELSSTMSNDGAIYTAIADLRSRRRAAAVQRELAVEAEAARVANQAKDQFLAILSHELRTPLTPVVAAVASLEETCRRQGVNAAETFAMIRRNLAFERRLIDDLLDVTRLTHGKLALKMETVDLEPLVREAATELSADARRKQLSVALDLRAAAGRPVQGDPDRLRQVFANLLRNAIKFTPVGGRLRVTMRSDRDKIRVAVRDTGIGFQPEEHERIFERFTQGAGAPPREGLGLGLAIARGIVREHEGTLEAQSRGVGKGACFTVTLRAAVPRNHAAATSTKQERRTGAQAATKRPDRRSVAGTAGTARANPALRPRILFVEDHADTAQVMASILENNGYQVRVAGSIAAALSLATDPFDVLVSDIGLPDGSGVDLMRELRGRGAFPAIALSGYGGAQDVKRSRASGFRRHLIKPIDPDELLDALREIAPRRPAKRA
jgi:signal transduction histidine kinase/ActR/RegA family two-component response regulator